MAFPKKSGGSPASRVKAALHPFIHPPTGYERSFGGPSIKVTTEHNFYPKTPKMNAPKASKMSTKPYKPEPMQVHVASVSAKAKKALNG